MMGGKWVLIISLALSGTLTHLFLFKQPVRSETDFTNNIPKQLGSWTMVSQTAPSESELRGLETTDIIKRVYSDGNRYMSLVVAYISRSNRKSAHAQEACLRGSGAHVGSLQKVRMENNPVDATVISIDHQNMRSRVYYWYKIKDQYTSDYLQSSFKMFLGGLFGQKSEGAALIRLLSPENKSESPEAAKEKFENFTSVLLPALEKYLNPALKN